MTNRRYQRGETLLLAILTLSMVIVLSSIILMVVKQSFELAVRTSQSDVLRQVVTSVQFYAEKNKEALLQNKKIDGISDPNAPVINELIAQKYLTTQGAGVTAPFGSQFKVTVTAQSGGAISGYVYLVGSVVGPNGQPDAKRACDIARSLAEIGFCSVLGNAALIGNGSIVITNPAGAVPASIAGYVFGPS